MTKNNQHNDYRITYRTDDGERMELIRSCTAVDARQQAKGQGIRRIQSVRFVPPIKFSSTKEFDEWADSVVPRIEY